MRIGIFILLLLAGHLHYRLWLGDGSVPDTAEVSRKAKQLQSGNEVMILRNSLLNEQIQELRAGGSAVEEIARTELGLIGTDETFLLIVD